MMPGKQKRKINIGLIGLGRLGEVYAHDLAGMIGGARLLAVADTHPGRARVIADQYEVPQWHTDPYAPLENQEIDAVVIVTPTHTHRDLVVAAAERGKAIFCEKPLALSLDDALRMKEVVARTGVFFHMAFMRRFDSGFRAAKRQIEDGAIGQPVVFKSTSRDPYPPRLEFADPRSSGGLIIDMGIHDFDLARWFMTEVKSVHAIGGTLAFPELARVGDIDNAIINMTFTDGRLGVVDLSRNGVYGYDIFTDILGTDGALRVGYLRQTPILVMKKNTVAHDTVPYFMERFASAYRAQLQDLVDALITDQPPSITIDEGIAAQRIAIAATLSQRESRILEMAEMDASWPS